MLTWEFTLHDIDIASLSDTRFADDGQLIETTFGYIFFSFLEMEAFWLNEQTWYRFCH